LRLHAIVLAVAILIALARVGALSSREDAPGDEAIQPWLFLAFGLTMALLARLTLFA
jgi:hypothetical protein